MIWGEKRSRVPPGFALWRERKRENDLATFIPSSPFPLILFSLFWQQRKKKKKRKGTLDIVLAFFPPPNFDDKKLFCRHHHLLFFLSFTVLEASSHSLIFFIYERRKTTFCVWGTSKYALRPHKRSKKIRGSCQLTFLRLLRESVVCVTYGENLCENACGGRLFFFFFFAWHCCDLIPSLSMRKEEGRFYLWSHPARQLFFLLHDTGFDTHESIIN